LDEEIGERFQPALSRLKPFISSLLQKGACNLRKEVAMRKKTFVKAVAIFACVSILMLSVPGATAAERSRKDYNFFKNVITKLAYFLPFLNLDSNVEKDDTTSNDDSNQKIKIAGTLKKSLVSKDD